MKNTNQDLLVIGHISEDFSKEEQLRFEFNLRLCKFLKNKRKELGLTQASLAQKSGVNRTTIIQLEKFQRTVSLDVMLKLLHALNVYIQFVDIES